MLTFRIMSFVIKDDELEHQLIRNTQLFQQYVIDNKNCTERKAKEIFTDDEVAKYADIFPDAKIGSRRRKILAFLQVHPELKSCHPEVIYQRIALYHNNYGAASLGLEPKRNTPIQDSIAQFE